MSMPFGVSPDGRWILATADLPMLPMARRVVMARDHIEIDGWVFPYASVSKNWLAWFRKILLDWHGQDVSERNKQWIDGILDAFQDGVTGKL